MRKNLFCVLLVGTVLALGAAPAAADDHAEGEIELLTDEPTAVMAGDTVWIALNWTAEDGPISDVALTVRKETTSGVEVTYPTNTGTFTGLMNGHELDEGEIDFTALRIFVPSDYSPKKVKLDLEISYWNGKKQVTDKIKVDVPVVRYTDGEHLVQHDAAASLAEGDSAWVDIDMTGLAPSVENVRVIVTGELPIVYPGDRAFTSLHGDERLEDGETDTARIRVDAIDVAPGAYELATELTYEYDGRTHSRSGLVQVTVTPAA